MTPWGGLSTKCEVSTHPWGKPWQASKPPLSDWMQTRIWTVSTWLLCVFMANRNMKNAWHSQMQTKVFKSLSAYIHRGTISSLHNVANRTVEDPSSRNVRNNYWLHLMKDTNFHSLCLLNKDLIWKHPTFFEGGSSFLLFCFFFGKSAAVLNENVLDHTSFIRPTE